MADPTHSASLVIDRDAAGRWRARRSRTLWLTLSGSTFAGYSATAKVYLPI